MPIEIINCEQRSEEWYRARLGIPTASMYATVMAKSGADSKGRSSYMRKLAGEILTNTPMESYSNEDMEAGIEKEPEIIARYAFERDVVVTPVGFIRNGRTGCSPDGLIGDDGMVQIKWASPHVMIEILLAGQVPAKHLPQCLGELMVSGRTWNDLVIGSHPGLPLFVHRVTRDEREILNLQGGVHQFNVELQAMVKKIEALS